VLLIACCYWKRANSWGAGAAILFGAIIPTGFTLVGGAPKLGKSWFALQVALAVAAGGYTFGKKIERGIDPMECVAMGAAIQAAIIKGEDQLWDVSLMKFIYEITRSSVPDNLRQLGSRGLLDMDSGGTPVDARVRIDKLFDKVVKGECEPSELRDELERWGLFKEYEDRFLNIFRQKR
jgi:hypothetical protein